MKTKVLAVLLLATLGGVWWLCRARPPTSLGQPDRLDESTAPPRTEGRPGTPGLATRSGPAASNDAPSAPPPEEMPSGATITVTMEWPPTAAATGVTWLAIHGQGVDESDLQRVPVADGARTWTGVIATAIEVPWAWDALAVGVGEDGARVYLAGAGSVDRPAPGDASIVARLVRSGSIEGAVLDAAGRPLAGISLKCWPDISVDAGRRHGLLAKLMMETIRADPAPACARTDGQGRYRIEGIPAGPWLIALQGPDRAMAYRPIDVRGAELAPTVNPSGYRFRFDGGDARMVFQSTPKPMARVRVVDAAGAPIEGAAVTWYTDWADIGGRGTRNVSRVLRSDANGVATDAYAERPGVTAPLTVRATAAGYRSELRRMPLTGQPFDLQVVLDRPGAVLSGSVVDEAGRGVPGARVEVSAVWIGPGGAESLSNASLAEVRTDSDGRWRVVSCRDDERYTISVHPPEGWVVP